MISCQLKDLGNRTIRDDHNYVLVSSLGCTMVSYATDEILPHFTLPIMKYIQLSSYSLPSYLPNRLLK